MWWLPLLAPIVGGTLDAADPAVVAILRADGRVQCTGTVITSHVVLTAAHCGVQDNPGGFRVAFGAQASAALLIVDVLDARANPGWTGTELADTAVVLVDSTWPTEPVPFAQGPVPSTVRIVGFGETASGAMDSGTRREGTAIVMSSTSDALVLAMGPALPCSGDSGGPVLAPGGEIIGVISRGDAACASYAKAARTEASRAFIDAYVAETWPDTAGLGEHCLHTQQCTTKSCIPASDDPAVRYCSRACTKDAGCGDGMRCDANRCQYPPPTPGALGAPCSDDADCVHGACESVGYCTVRCVSAEADCPARFTCEHAGGVEFFCAPAPEGGGCCDASGGGAGTIVLALGVLLLSRGRRCSSRCT